MRVLQKFEGILNEIEHWIHIKIKITFLKLMSEVSV